ncbi:hypothetical protein ABIB94_008341 [Bradyrhizobium sp. JR7.2]|uniref:DUF2806 domain-containing protein n=1 Tax=unclassified Bradyrhizobium TaxID=2631580 RepID=UPI003391DE82
MDENLPVPPADGLPTLSDVIANWLGFQLPSIPMPQTVKNFDKAVGKVFLATGENAEARIKASTGKVKAAGKIAIDGMYRTEEERRKIQNRADVLAIAVEELNSTSSQQQDATEEIDDDWLNLFAKIAEDKSSDELKGLFGRILAGEIRKPGSFALRTLQFLSTLSKSDAHEISNFLSLVVGNVVPAGDNLVSFNQRVLMQELGVASHASTMGGLAWNFVFPPTTKTLLACRGAGIVVANETEKPIKVSLNGQVLTKTGSELLKIANPPSTDMNYLKEVAQIFFELIREAGHAEEIVNLGTVSVLAGMLQGEGMQVLYKATMPGQPPQT